MTHIADHSPSLDGIAIFLSRRHPGRSSWYWTFSMALVRPLSICLLPLMIAAVIAVLQGFPALLYLTVGAPIALALAATWTVYQLMVITAEVHVREGFAAVRSVWDVLVHQKRVAWVPILDLRHNTDQLILGLGDASYVLDRNDWPDASALLDLLRLARDAVYAV